MREANEDIQTTKRPQVSYYDTAITPSMCSMITPNTPVSVLTLSDTNNPSRSFAHHLAQRYSSMHSSIAREGALRSTTLASTKATAASAADTPSYESVKIIQTSIEPQLNAAEAKVEEADTHSPSVHYHQDDNTKETDIKSKSIGGKGFDLIVGLKLLCYCNNESNEEPACGGVAHSAEAIKNFFVTKLLANFKDERSIAYITGGCLLTEKVSVQRMLNQLPPEIALFGLINPSYIEQLAVGLTDLIRQEKASYLHGLETIKQGITLFNKSAEAKARGFTATLKITDGDHTRTEVGGYTITVNNPTADAAAPMTKK